MITTLLCLFGCHSHLSRPFGSERRMYRVCLDCAARLPFRWDEVWRLKPLARR